MKTFFRVDASSRIGTGHFMRCLALAKRLRERKVDCVFVSREHEGHLLPLLADKHIPACVLPALASGRGAPDSPYASWLGATPAEDAAQTIAALGGERPDWLVADHYAIDVRWERELRPHVSRVMAIDDLADREHDCDLLLDQNFDAGMRPRYAGLVPRGCPSLLGPRYALLAPEYARSRGPLRQHSGRIARVAVFFGGSDPYGATELALSALALSKLRKIHVDVVLGANHPARERVDALAGALPAAEIHGSLPSLSALMMQTDLAVGAAGVTAWERMCLGVPSVVVSVAHNQKQNAESLAHARHIIYAGPVSGLSSRALAQLLDQLQDAPEVLSELSVRGQLLVDGRGAERVAEAMFPGTRADFRLREATSEDVVHYFAWASDPQVRMNAINTEAFTWISHQAWFREKLHSRASRLLVLEVRGLPVGQIRFDTVAGEIRIHYSLDALVRGRGWGTELVALGVARIREESALPLRAVVKPGNGASHAVLRRLGFISEPVGPDLLAQYVLEARDRGTTSDTTRKSRGAS